MYGEAGVSYFNEDFRSAPDRAYTAARWSLRVFWPFWNDRMTFFHFHEGYPSLKRIRDIYITTETGLRFNVTTNFNAGVQVNWRYTSTPATRANGEELKRGDTLYLFTLGYNFET